MKRQKPETIGIVKEIFWFLLGLCLPLIGFIIAIHHGYPEGSQAYWTSGKLAFFGTVTFLIILGIKALLSI